MTGGPNPQPTLTLLLSHLEHLSLWCPDLLGVSGKQSDFSWLSSLLTREGTMCFTNWGTLW